MSAYPESAQTSNLTLRVSCGSACRLAGSGGAWSTDQIDRTVDGQPRHAFHQAVSLIEVARTRFCGCPVLTVKNLWRSTGRPLGGMRHAVRRDENVRRCEDTFPHVGFWEIGDPCKGVGANNRTKPLCGWNPHSRLAYPQTKVDHRTDRSR